MRSYDDLAAEVGAGRAITRRRRYRPLFETTEQVTPELVLVDPDLHERERARLNEIALMQSILADSTMPAAPERRHVTALVELPQRVHGMLRRMGT